MRRVIAYVLVLSCCAGLLLGAHRSLMAAEDDLEFTEEVICGDASALASRTVEQTIVCGQHMTWHSAYTFGQSNTYDTEFVFTQDERQEPVNSSNNSLNIDTTSGFGFSGSYDLSTSDYGKLVQAVADQTPAGSESQQTLVLGDYVDNYFYYFNLNYLSAQRSCYEWMDLDNVLLGTTGTNSTSYYALTQAFRFPVQPEDTVQIGVGKDASGNLNYFNYQYLGDTLLYFLTGLNDRGCYLLPVFQDGDGTPLEAEYPDGYGLYFIPWKETGEEHIYRLTGEAADWKTQVVTMDVSKAENLYPLDPAVRVWAMELNEDATKAWLLTEEQGAATVTVLDLVEGICLNRFVLFPATEELSWTVDEGLILVISDTQAAVLDTAQAGSLLFTTQIGDVPQAASALSGYDPHIGTAEYWDGRLILADTLWPGKDSGFWVMVLTQQGVEFLGEYRCSIFEGNEPSYFSFISGEDYPLVLK